MVDRLGRGDRISLGGGALLVISLFLSWYKAGPFSANAFDALDLIDILLLILGAGVVILILGIAAGRIDAIYGPATLAAGIIALLLVLFRMIDKPGPGGAGIGLAYGIFIALISAVAICVGQVMKAQE